MAVGSRCDEEATTGLLSTESKGLFIPALTLLVVVDLLTSSEVAALDDDADDDWLLILLLFLLLPLPLTPPSSLAFLMRCVLIVVVVDDGELKMLAIDLGCTCGDFTASLPSIVISFSVLLRDILNDQRIEFHSSRLLIDVHYSVTHGVSPKI